jgi:hypothetical protein
MMIFLLSEPYEHRGMDLNALMKKTVQIFIYKLTTIMNSMLQSGREHEFTGKLIKIDSAGEGI